MVKKGKKGKKKRQNRQDRKRELKNAAITIVSSMKYAGWFGNLPPELLDKILGFDNYGFNSAENSDWEIIMALLASTSAWWHQYINGRIKYAEEKMGNNELNPWFSIVEISDCILSAESHFAGFNGSAEEYKQKCNKLVNIPKHYRMLATRDIPFYVLLYDLSGHWYMWEKVIVAEKKETINDIINYLEFPLDTFYKKNISATEVTIEGSLKLPLIEWPYIDGIIKLVLLCAKRGIKVTNPKLSYTVHIIESLSTKGVDVSTLYDKLDKTFDDLWGLFGERVDEAERKETILAKVNAFEKYVINLK